MEKTALKKDEMIKQVAKDDLMFYANKLINESHGVFDKNCTIPLNNFTFENIKEGVVVKCLATFKRNEYVYDSEQTIVFRDFVYLYEKNKLLTGQFDPDYVEFVKEKLKNTYPDYKQKFLEYKNQNKAKSKTITVNHLENLASRFKRKLNDFFESFEL